jgi:hypothetical protein
MMMILRTLFPSKRSMHLAIGYCIVEMVAFSDLMPSVMIVRGEKAANNVHSTSQVSGNTRKDNIINVPVLINELQIQDPHDVVDDLCNLPPSTTAMGS